MLPELIDPEKTNLSHLARKLSVEVDGTDCSPGLIAPEKMNCPHLPPKLSVEVEGTDYSLGLLAPKKTNLHHLVLKLSVEVEGIVCSRKGSYSFTLCVQEGTDSFRNELLSVES